jgi:hypothetical protein
MPEFALLKDAQLQEIRDLDARPPDAPHKGFIWLPVLRKEGPEEFTGAREETVEGQRGMYWVIATLSPEFRPAPPVDVPESITRRQCALELYARSYITLEEALAMTKSAEVPAAIATVFSKLPTAEMRMLAEIDFAAINYYRNNSLLGEMGLTSPQIDEFFISAGQR